MDLSTLLSNLLSPPILLFIVGVAAALLKSDLAIPEPLPRLFSLYLLWAIGFKGGVQFSKAGFSPEVLLQLLACVGLSLIVPLYSYGLLRRRLDPPNAAAVAATYGSVSAVTFVTAAAFLERRGVEYSGHMVAALALMESPAIVVSVILMRLAQRGVPGDTERRGSNRFGHVVKESFLNGAVFLLLGSLVAGLLTGERGWVQVRPFAVDIFPGVLSFFLLDMGLAAARRLSDLRRAGPALICFALVAPLFNAALGCGLAWLLGMSRGDAVLLVVLSASASYIAVPAAAKLAFPGSSPSVYLPMSLGLTFPFNITIGLPLYSAVIDLMLPASAGAG